MERGRPQPRMGHCAPRREVPFHAEDVDAFLLALSHGWRTSCHLIKWMPGACGMGREGSGCTDFVPLEFPDAGTVEAERGNTRWDANGNGC